MKQTLLSIVLIFAYSFSFGAGSENTIKRKCGSIENLNRLKQLDPDMESRMAQLEVFTNAYSVARNQEIGSNTVNAPITIPVVFHIVYNSPSQNISDAQCQAQINQLNLDFAKMNTDASNVPFVWQGIAANTNIQFCLAKRDPNGAATTGIERRSTTITSFFADDNVKQYNAGGMNPWPSSSYLNIWVANLGGGLLGYAQYPGGPSASDGVVLLYSTVGSMQLHGSMANYNLGRTATHEVGHWLNLVHIWGDDSGCAGSDNVGDTPNQGTESYGCPTFPHTDGCSSVSPGVMFMNYMDYVDDACMNMFTSGQSTRMNALFSVGGPRASLLSSNGCQPPSTASTCGVATGLTASSITSNSATVSWTPVSGANSYVLKYKKSTATTWSTVTTTTNSKSLSNLSGSTKYQFQIQAVCNLGGGGYSTISSFTTLIAPPCGIPFSLVSANVTPGGATLSWGAVSGAITYTLQYKVTNTNSWSGVSTTSNSKALSGLTPGTNYTFQVSANCQSGPGSFSSQSSFTTAPSNCTDANEPNNTYLSGVAVATNTDISGQINVATDADWFTFTTTAPNTKILIVLSNLPKDYNMTLYNSSLMQLATTAATGTTNDSIRKNFNSAGTYYLKVIGKNGVFDPVICYNLRINVSNTNFRIDNEEPAEEVISFQRELSVFPNPVKDVLNVNFNSTGDESVTIRVFNMVGKTVIDLPVEAIEGENKHAFDFSVFHKGIYFVEFLQGGNKITKKIIRE